MNWPANLLGILGVAITLAAGIWKYRRDRKRWPNPLRRSEHKDV